MSEIKIKWSETINHIRKKISNPTVGSWAWVDPLSL